MDKSLKRNKLSLVTLKYELFSMEEGEYIQSMFECFQAILNELRYLGRTYDNYDYIDKILRSLSRKWRVLVTVLRALKNLDSMSFEKLVGALKVHEQELQHDEGPKREKSLALNSQKHKKVSLSKEKASRSSSKALKDDDSFDEEFEEEYDEDELTFIS
uniref:UBN2 domain-containing protein n=1 Tax=Glycine max TaxID=3847 RepID=A0A0R0GCY8_SOYBN